MPWGFWRPRGPRVCDRRSSTLSFPVPPWGCSVTLARGVRLLFPAGATTAPVTIHYQLWPPRPGLVSLGPHDSLLSSVLELRPHGLTFWQARPRQEGVGVEPPGPAPALTWPPARQDVSLWLLVVPPRTRLCREVVVRTRSDGSWSDLETFLEEEAPKVRASQAWPGAVHPCPLFLPGPPA